MITQYVKTFRKNFFGLVSINYLVEDRRPDLDNLDINLAVCGGKYKHFIVIRILTRGEYGTVLISDWRCDVLLSNGILYHTAFSCVKIFEKIYECEKIISNQKTIF